MIYLYQKWKPMASVRNFVYSYPKRRKQFISINNAHSMLQTLHSCVPQGSILGPLLFNIFVNDRFYFIKDVQLLNFADDNTIATFSNSNDDLITELKKNLKSP